MLQLIVLAGQVLVLVEEVVDLELGLGQRHLSSTELILELDQFVLKLDPAFALVIKVGLEAVLGLPELLALVFEHELELVQPAVLVGHCVGEGVLLGGILW